MTDKAMGLPAIMSSLLRRTRTVLLTTAAINVDAVERFDDDVSVLDLHDVTAIAGFRAPVEIRTAFCFDLSLLDALSGRITADIQVPKGQEDLFARDTAAEVANMVQGLCSADFPNLGQVLSLRPPTVLLGERHIIRPKDALFGTMRMRTPNGWLSIHLLRPDVLFDSQLHYKNC
ncbi:MAG: chemotaxis protein CheX [Rhodospirillum sp.]|nr:chemotaxis protein CheX [Rhodospirillum sp.]MCF8492150.1 chemotaxis protein CheX [Rhodospirillum sp.]MCF8502593.1 chemotaxis protein CheX [Rhodospirillum sp.]